MLQRQDKGNN